MLRWLLSLVHNSVVAMKAQGHQLVTRARKGDTGAVGISYRVSYWQAGKEYHNDINNTTASERYIDICVKMPISLIGDANFRAYQCVSTHTSDATTNTLGKAGLWTSINSLKPLVTPLMLANKIVADYIDVANLAADSAFINALTVLKLIVKNANNNIIAKIGDMDNYTVDGETGKYPFWIGGPTPADSVTKVKSDGELITSKIKATGGTLEELTTQRLRNPFGTITDSFTPIDDDNVVSDVLGGGSFRYSYSLDWTVKSSGRRQTIIGAVSIDAPSGKYFYENGRKYTEFNSSYECTEMIGYGNDTTFYGWIVVRRTLFSTNYNFGREVTPLAMGRVNGYSASASFAICKTTNKDNATVDGSNVMKVDYAGTTGHSYLYCPKSWFVSANYIGVHLTGYGYVSGSSTAPAGADVVEITSTTLSGYNVWRIEVVVHDDDTPNAGSFFFQLYNMAQWDD